ncbi:HTH-type transcriptional repressor KstR2 [Paraconexibacter sp. AEG42_29]|uniref:HTH-type transcriptional repressor KstR2 n=1 Tax=Paraconexibacter sp. AEG42_29 TaxID=2997339 RepID=A0AAU7AXN5_9ACTN
MTSPPPPGRREAIIQTATVLFARDGYAAVGMRSIAAAVGIRASSLYHHFPSKVDLLHAVCEVATAAFISAQLPELERPGSPAERLGHVLREHVLYFHEHRLEETVGRRELAALQQQAPALFDEIQATRRGYQRALQDVIEAGVAAGEFDVEDANLATLALLGLVNSVNTWFQEDGPDSIEAVADAFVAMGVGRLLAGPLAASPTVPSAAAAAAAGPVSRSRPARGRGSPA